MRYHFSPFPLFSTAAQNQVSMKKKNAVKVVFDRKNVSAQKGTGKVEICIYLSRLQRKFITICKATPLEWQKVARRKDVVSEVQEFEKEVEVMQMLGEDMTIENFDAHLNYGKKAKEEKKAKEILKVTEELKEEPQTFNGFVISVTVMVPDLMKLRSRMSQSKTIFSFSTS